MNLLCLERVLSTSGTSLDWGGPENARLTWSLLDRETSQLLEKVGWIKLIQRLVRFMHRRQHGLVSITGRQMG
jgi:hypothetical protein